jgi:hypothetical protein
MSAPPCSEGQLEKFSTCLGAVAAFFCSHAFAQGRSDDAWLQKMRGCPIIRRSSLRIDAGASPWNSRPGATAASFAAVRPKPGQNATSPWKQAIVATKVYRSRSRFHRTSRRRHGPAHGCKRRSRGTNLLESVDGKRAGYRAPFPHPQIVGNPGKRCSHRTRLPRDSRTQKMAGTRSKDRIMRTFWQANVATKPTIMKKVYIIIICNALL